ncbi:hypothetical protein F4680DRAFT_446198 [Xylaria scruposa]|nr:hypothetical protein F4680DRAFT_446198 [Xylaria scruposa]
MQVTVCARIETEVGTPSRGQRYLDRGFPTDESASANSGSLTAMTMLPPATYLPYSSNLTTPYANSMRMDCISYITTPFLVGITENNNTVTISSCSDAVAAYGVSLADFLLWNPDLSNGTSWADLPCQIIETPYGLSHARFVAWNPAVLNNCTGMYPGYDYCVSIPHYKPTYTSTTPPAPSFTPPAGICTTTA